MADFTEKQLEDWLAANWDAEHGKALFPYLPSIRKDVEFVGRQVHCQYGIIDLLAFTGRTFIVVELKAVTADERVVEQVIRYQRSIEEAALATEFDVSLGMGLGYPSGDATNTTSVVIAPGFTRKALKTLNLIGSPVLVSFDGSRFSFSMAGVQRGKSMDGLRHILRPYIASAIGREAGEKASNAIRSAQTVTVYEN